MPSRRYHNKSRAGCAQCKLRRIKCDETHPSCHQCSRSKVHCSFSGSAAGSVASRSPQTAEAPPIDPNINKQDFDGPPPAQFDCADMYIMHHYSTTTSKDLYPAPDSQSIWCESLPQASQTSPMILHGLLALGALDLARRIPARQDDYLDKAAFHQQAGIQYFKGTFNQSSPNPSETHLRVAFGAILIICAFALPIISGEAPSLERILDHFALIRGPSIFWSNGQSPIADTSISSLVTHKEPGITSATRQEIKNQLEKVRSSLEDESCKDALDKLDRCLQICSADPHEVVEIGRWPAGISSQYEELLKQRDPSALWVLAHYALLFAHIEQRWWFSGWARIILRAVEAAVPAGSSSISASDLAEVYKLSGL